MNPHTTQRLYHQLHQGLLAFVRRRVASNADAEDIVQDIFVRIHTHSAALEEAQSASGWIHRVARNAVVDHHRARGAAQRAVVALAREPLVWQTERSQAQDDAAQELAGCIRPFVELLGEEQRQALMLTDLGTLSQKEAALQAGVSVSGMKSRVQRGRANLGVLLRQCCEIEQDVRRRVIGYTPRGLEDGACCD